MTLLGLLSKSSCRAYDNWPQALAVLAPAADIRLPQKLSGLLADGILLQNANMAHPLRQPDIEVMFELTSSRFNGEQKVVLSGYRPIYEISAEYWSSAHHEFVGVERLITGERAMAKVWFFLPEAYPQSLWAGRKLRVAEASRIVGVAEVIRIINPDLQATDTSHSL